TRPGVIPCMRCRIECWTRMQLRFYVRRAIPARGSSRSLERLEFHISMRPTSPAADPSVPARVLRSARPAGTRVAVGPVGIGGPGFVVAAGPCAVESAAQTEAAAEVVAAAGAHLLRGGVFKPRTSPYAFQGLGEAGLSILGRSGARHGLPVVAEVLEPSQL